jgi:hypothetical protein
VNTPHLLTCSMNKYIMYWIEIRIVNENFKFTISSLGITFEIKFRKNLVIWGGLLRYWSPSTACPFRAWNDCGYRYYGHLYTKKIEL